jgi:hypothetical protein
MRRYKTWHGNKNAIKHFRQQMNANNTLNFQNKSSIINFSKKICGCLREAVSCHGSITLFRITTVYMKY